MNEKYHSGIHQFTLYLGDFMSRLPPYKSGLQHLVRPQISGSDPRKVHPNIPNTLWDSHTWKRPTRETDVGILKPRRKTVSILIFNRWSVTSCTSPKSNTAITLSAFLENLNNLTSRIDSLPVLPN